MIEIRGITKSYGKGKGINDLWLNGQDGEVISLIGPNGSGKSTSQKGIAGLIKLEKGCVLLDGKDTLHNNTKREIGYLPEKSVFDGNMTGYELIEMINVLKYQKFDGTEEEQMHQMLQDFDLWESRHIRIRNYSVGMCKKLGIIIALMKFPKLIILDEPTNAVDTKGIITLKRYMKQATEKGCIIIISSHVLDFVSSISTKNIFLKNGKVERIVEENREINLEDIYKELYL